MCTSSWCMVPTNGFMDSFRLAFDDKATSDVIFSVQGKLIHVHKAVLEIRCEHFRSMFRNEWQEAKKDVIEINEYVYPVYHAFLQYIYTDKLEVAPIIAIALMDLANTYFEQELKLQCGRILKRAVSVDSVAILYATAIKYGRKDLEDFCFRYICNRLTAVSQTPGLKELDHDILIELLAKAGKQGAFKH